MAEGIVQANGIDLKCDPMTDKRMEGR